MYSFETERASASSLSITMTLCRVSFWIILFFASFQTHLLLSSEVRKTNYFTELLFYFWLISEMYFFAIQIILFGLVSTVCCKILFQKNEDFDNTFCVDKMLPHGETRSSIECANLCSQINLCTGFFFDEERYCFLTEEYMSNVNACSFRKGRYFINLGMFFSVIWSYSKLAFIHRDKQSNTISLWKKQKCCLMLYWWCVSMFSSY